MLDFAFTLQLLRIARLRFSQQKYSVERATPDIFNNLQIGLQSTENEQICSQRGTLPLKTLRVGRQVIVQQRAGL